MQHGGLKVKDRKMVRAEGKPLISVITVVLNGEKYLERTIRSVLNQSYQNIEYIIVDGNSSDRTVEIIKKFEERIDYWISESDKGISDAFNKGFRYSTGDFVSFINSDDWYEPDSIAKAAEEFKSEHIIYCGHMNLFSEKNQKFVKLHRSRPDRIFQTMRIAHPATFVPRKAFLENEGFSTAYKYAMDYDFMLKSKLNGYEFRVLDLVISNQIMGGTTSDLMKVFRDELAVKNNNLGFKIKHLYWYLINVVFYKAMTIFKLSVTND